MVPLSYNMFREQDYSINKDHKSREADWLSMQ